MVKKSKTRARRVRPVVIHQPPLVTVSLTTLQDVHALASQALGGLRAMRMLLDASRFPRVHTEGLYLLLGGPMGELDAAVDELTPLARRFCNQPKE
jgi:hypothetical protein